MRTHLQGTFLLIVLLLALWAMLNWAGPVIDSALGGADGAIVAKAPAEPDEQADADGRFSEQDDPLDGAEVAELQSALALVGYDPGPVDGIMGDLTRGASDEAKEDLGLAAASDRRLLDTLSVAVEALSSATSEPDS